MVCFQDRYLAAGSYMMLTRLPRLSEVPYMPGTISYIRVTRMS